MTKSQLQAKGYEFISVDTPGKIKWVDSRDGEGVLKDAEGNEYYFESSSSPLFDFAMRNHTGVTFEIVSIPSYGRMAFNVKAEYSSNLKELL